MIAGHISEFLILRVGGDGTREFASYTYSWVIVLPVWKPHWETATLAMLLPGPWNWLLSLACRTCSPRGGCPWTWSWAPRNRPSPACLRCRAPAWDVTCALHTSSAAPPGGGGGTDVGTERGPGGRRRRAEMQIPSAPSPAFGVYTEWPQGSRGNYS